MKNLTLTGSLRRVLAVGVVAAFTTSLVAGVGGTASASGAAPALHCQPGSTSDVALPSGGHADVLDTLAQVLPDKPQVGAGAVTICGARNSFASFQLEVRAGTTPLAAVSMTASSLSGPNGSVIPGTSSSATATRVPDVQFSREDTDTLTTMSDGELATVSTVTPAASVVPRNSSGVCTSSCQFPDILVPDRDSLYGEARNAFPFAVPANQDKTVWVDVFIPSSATAGTYTGTVTVANNSGTSTIPVQLQVASVTLPSTSTTHSVFFTTAGLSGAQYAQYAELGLDNRISISPGSALTGSTTPLTALLKGTDPAVKLSGAALTDFAMSLGSKVTGSSGWSAAQFAQYKALITAAGAQTSPWAYCDEDDSSDCASHYASETASGWAGVPLLAIDAPEGHDWPDPNAKDAAGNPTVVPAGLGSAQSVASKLAVAGIVQYLDPIAGYSPYTQAGHTPTGSRVPALSTWRAASPSTRQVWAYSSNMSGGSGSGNPVFSGWPSYGVDQVASEQEAMGWQEYLNGIDGEVYWLVNNPASASMNAANSQLVGDGTLFYAVGTYGGTDSIPLESIRLKRIRDGRQDAELLKLAVSSGQGAAANSIATTLFAKNSTGSLIDSSAVAPSAMDSAEQSLLALFPLPSTTTGPFNSHDLDCNGTPDFLAVQASTGALLFYPRTSSDWAPNAPINEGSGYGGVYSKLMLAGDLNGDGSPDLLGLKANGSLWLMAGNCTGTFAAPVAVGSTVVNPTAVGDFNGDGHPDLVDQHSDGTLWLLAGNGKGGFAPAVQIGSGWSGFTLTGVGDANGDGAVDILARTGNGSATLYEGNGRGGWSTVNAGVSVSTSLPTATDPQVFGVGDTSGDGIADLVALTSTGQLIRYNGNGTGNFASTGTVLGNGWSTATLSQVAN